MAFLMLAEWTGLEPATPGVTGRYSNQLNYHSSCVTFALSGQVTSLCRLAVTYLRFDHLAMNLGDPTGIRTPVLTVKG